MTAAARATVLAAVSGLWSRAIGRRTRRGADDRQRAVFLRRHRRPVTLTVHPPGPTREATVTRRSSLTEEWDALMLESWLLFWNAPVVIGLRYMKAAQMAHKPGWWLDPEWSRMVNEKVVAASQAQQAMFRASFSPFHPWSWPYQSSKTTRAALRPYSRRVRSNVSRLSRG